ncbi:MAG: T9SS type A sorting domain-containing protein [Bacteroidia bacterium]
MKRLVLMGITALTAVCALAQNKTVVKVTGDITANRTFYRDTIYELSGLVYVKNNATLTIEAGTVVKGGLAPDNSNATALVIDKSGKIIAIGTPTQPIIFTSAKAAGQREYGDWGGIVFFGEAPVNKVNPSYENGVIPGTFGGNNPTHNQGTIKYASIEFAGYPFEANRELNSMTLCGVGSGTTISYIQCSYNNDDAFEWFGGTVNLDHIIAYRTNDDDFDVDFGYSGKVQFGVSLSDTSIADVSTKNGFEIDNDANGSTEGPISSAIFSNMTVIGAYYNKSFVDQTGLHGRGAHIRRNSSVSIFNTAWIGWKEGNRMDGSNTLNKYLTDSATLANNVYAGNLTNFTVAGGADLTLFTTYVTNPGNLNRQLNEVNDAMLMDPYNYNGPNFTPSAGSPLLTGAGFANGKLAGFTQTTYVGAFGQNDTWDSGWTEFNPVNANYDLLNSVGKIENVANLNVYPNPTAQSITVAFDLTYSTEVSVEVMDLTGRVVANPLVDSFMDGGAQSLTADMSSLKNGVYFVVIKTAEGVQSTKVVVNR